MDKMVSMLESVPADVIEKSLTNPFAKGFLMGMLHQTIVSDAIYQMQKDQEEGEEGPE